MTENITARFGENVFGEEVMKKRLSSDVYLRVRDCIKEGTPLPDETAGPVAKAMMEWAIEKGATHFTHWFQPLNGVTAEKHDSFLDKNKQGEPIAKFSKNALVKGESDASSFPSGGLRATFEARGYTAWDPSSYAYVRGGSLYIPTVFCSYAGEALDKKTPLLRSAEALSSKAVRLLNMLGRTEVNKVIPSVGAEQEYFLIDKGVYEKRLDLVTCGRTLFGAKPPKGQELEDHYFGKIKARVARFMEEVDSQLWSLGVFAKTKHNEAAPAQHELAPVYTTYNIATDHNQLTMAVLKSVAEKHGMVCLLHEKPFAGVNGSGKHNNWSIVTDGGENLLDGGENAGENVQFLLILSCVLAAVDDYQDLLRISVASAGNDHRLGAHEAPPAIVSAFIGEEIERMLESLLSGERFKKGQKKNMEMGASVLPHFYKDANDRNRTSPFAFTGNKFEFRMVGSAQSIADSNIVLNTIVADAFDKACKALEGSSDVMQSARLYAANLYAQHKRIIFNGNNYSEQWVKEAKARGLSNLETTVDAYERYTDQKNVELFTSLGVLSESEMVSRREISFESYYKTVYIEGETLIEMLDKEIIPAVIGYKAEVAACINALKQAGGDTSLEDELLGYLSGCTSELCVRSGKLKQALFSVKGENTPWQNAKICRKKVLPAMAALRDIIDSLEIKTSKKHWLIPDYSDVLYSVK